MIRHKMPGPYVDIMGPTVLTVILMMSIVAQFSIKLYTLMQSSVHALQFVGLGKCETITFTSVESLKGLNACACVFVVGNMLYLGVQRLTYDRNTISSLHISYLQYLLNFYLLFK